MPLTDCVRAFTSPEVGLVVRLAGRHREELHELVQEIEPGRSTSGLSRAELIGWVLDSLALADPTRAAEKARSSSIPAQQVSSNLRRGERAIQALLRHGCAMHIWFGLEVPKDQDDPPGVVG